MSAPAPDPAVMATLKQAVRVTAAEFSRAVDDLLRVEPSFGFRLTVEMFSCMADCIRQRFDSDGQVMLLSMLESEVPHCGENALKVIRNAAVLHWLSAEWQCGLLRQAMVSRLAAASGTAS